MEQVEVRAEVAQDPEFVGIASGDHGSPRRLADWRLAPGAREAHALLGQPTEIRRAHDWVTGAAQRVVRVLVREDEDEIGLAHPPMVPRSRSTDLAKIPDHAPCSYTEEERLVRSTALQEAAHSGIGLRW